MLPLPGVYAAFCVAYGIQPPGDTEVPLLQPGLDNAGWATEEKTISEQLFNV
jgi:hypothetical protein